MIQLRGWLCVLLDRIDNIDIHARGVVFVAALREVGISISSLIPLPHPVEGVWLSGGGILGDLDVRLAHQGIVTRTVAHLALGKVRELLLPLGNDWPPGDLITAAIVEVDSGKKNTALVAPGSLFVPEEGVGESLLLDRLRGAIDEGRA